MDDGGRNPFGARLRELREAAGLTQEALAERAGVTVDAIASIERGRRRRPYPHTLAALIDALGLSAEGRAALLAALPARALPRPAPAEAITIPLERTTLPTPPTPLIGRERERAALVGLLAAGAVRLVTLTGPGGVGKTRLALAAAAGVGAAFPDAVAFVSLAPLADAGLVVPTIALGFGGRETGERSARDDLLALLGDRRALLVLDNCEHILESAPEVAGLLGACPGLVILATSRAPLRLRGEREWPVGPLAFPDPDRVPEEGAVASVPAVALFVERARAVRPGFALDRANATAVAAICRSLDGLPLALELAAARLRMLTPSELLARLDRALPLLAGGARDLPARQRTMRDAIAWSHDLLEPEAQALFRRLAPFAGGWDLEAAAAAGDMGGVEVFDLVAGLVEQSLVAVEAAESDATRYRLLEPVREYATEQLAREPSGPGEAAATRDRHAAHFLALAEAAALGLREAGRRILPVRLDVEQDNFRAALGWLFAPAADDTARVEDGLRLAGALWPFWELGGRLDEARRWLDLALEKGSGVMVSARARVLDAAGWLAQWQGDMGGALRYHQEGARLCRQLGDRVGLVAALRGVGSMLLALEEAPRAIPFIEESVAVAREVGDPRQLAESLARFGAALSLEREHARARAPLEESLALQRSFGDQLGVGNALFGLAVAALEERDYAQLRTILEEGLAAYRSVDYHLGVAFGLEMLAMAAALQELAARTVRIWAAADALRDEAGSRRVPYVRRYERHVDAMYARLDDDARRRTEAEGRALTLDEAIAYALRAEGEEAISAE